MLNLALKLEKVKKRIKEIAFECKRNPEEIKLIVVTKGIDISIIKEILTLGVKEIGENRVSEALKKYKQIKDSVSWHMLGHLQTNKVKKAVQIFSLIHSVDSLSLALEINKRAKAIEKKMPVLIQVNISEEKTKFGILLSNAIALILELTKLENLEVKGLMTIAPFTQNKILIRKCFRKLKELKEEIEDRKLENIKMEYLSMGMSNDFEIAIEEGANILRLGSIIFK